MLGHLDTLSRIEAQLRRPQPNWGQIELWMSENGWAPAEGYQLTIPEEFPMGGVSGMPAWVLPYDPRACGVTVDRNLFGIEELPRVWSRYGCVF